MGMDRLDLRAALEWVGKNGRYFGVDCANQFQNKGWSYVAYGKKEKDQPVSDSFRCFQIPNISSSKVIHSRPLSYELTWGEPTG